MNETLPYWLEIYDYFDNSSFIFDYGLNITVNNSGYFDNSAIYDFSYSQVLGIVMQALGGGAVPKIKALEKWQAQILLISSNEIEEDEEIISYSTIYKFRIWILNILELFKEIMVGSNG